MTVHDHSGIHDPTYACPERIIAGRRVGACQITVMPAMHPVGDADRKSMRFIADVYVADPWATPQYAYCRAQSLADRDGQRRRVYRDGGVWHVALAEVAA